jgi:hypothetical protein
LNAVCLQDELIVLLDPTEDLQDDGGIENADDGEEHEGPLAPSPAIYQPLLSSSIDEEDEESKESGSEMEDAEEQAPNSKLVPDDIDQIIDLKVRPRRIYVLKSSLNSFLKSLNIRRESLPIW